MPLKKYKSGFLMMQVFIPWVKTLPQDEVKVLIGDNLAAHLSPVVIAQCEEYNIRFIFLPENATHMLQPLDVTVFGPMKRRWREILADWKGDNLKRGINYSSIPKQVIVDINYKRSCSLSSVADPKCYRTRYLSRILAQFSKNFKTFCTKKLPLTSQKILV
jgi:hypothetical protein